MKKRTTRRKVLQKGAGFATRGGGGRERNEKDMVVGHYVQGGYTDVRKKGQRGP